MSQFVISLISIARMLVEIAGMSLIAQGVLFLFAGERRGENVVYQFFRIVTRPAILATRFFVPKRVVDRRIPFITFFLLLSLWIALAYVRLYMCGPNGLACS